MLISPEPVGDAGELAVPLAGLADPTGDDERCPCLVDQDRVDLVDDRVVVAALHPVLRAHRHVVAEVVETELVVRAVGDVGAVRRQTLVRQHVGLDEPNLETEETVDLPHPVRVTFRQVVVDRDEVNTSPDRALR